MIIQGVSYPSDFEAKKAMIAAAARLAGKGAMVSGDGSLSVRVGPNAIWMSVEGADKENLTQDMLVRIDLNGKQTATSRPKPLGEDLSAHLRIYRENENVRCVLHGYPVCAAVLSACGQGIEEASFSPAVRKMGAVSLLRQEDMQSQTEKIAMLCRKDQAVLLENNGCMAWGGSVSEALSLIETMEYYCKVKTALSGCGEKKTCAACTGACKSAPAAAPAPAALPRQEAIPGLTPLIQPGQALPVLPAQEAAPVSTPAAPVSVPQVSAVNTPKTDVMAEVVRRVMGMK